MKIPFLSQILPRRRVTTITEDLTLFHSMRAHARSDQAARQAQRETLRRRIRRVVIGKETHIIG